MMITVIWMGLLFLQRATSHHMMGPPLHPAALRMLLHILRGNVGITWETHVVPPRKSYVSKICQTHTCTRWCCYIFSSLLIKLLCICGPQDLLWRTYYQGNYKEKCFSVKQGLVSIHLFVRNKKDLWSSQALLASLHNQPKFDNILLFHWTPLCWF